MPNELKPCPFCSCKTIYLYTKPFRAICARCKVEMVRSNKKRLIDAWNRRAGEK